MELQCQIQDLLHASIRTFNLKENDAVSLKTLKLILVGQVLEGLGLSWNELITLFKTHTPIHPEIARVLQEIGDEEVSGTVAQIFVRNEKLVRMMKGFSQQGHAMEALLAVDGVSGPHAPNFEPKYYVGNLRFGRQGDPKSPFDNEPDYKRKHVQVIREIYNKLDKVSCPDKHIYQMLRCMFLEYTGTKLPEIELDEKLDKRLQEECSQYYRLNMGKENIEQMAKSVKRSRGDKRALEKEEEVPAEKR